MKYKIGDKVRCLQEAVQHYVPEQYVGKIGVIINIVKKELYDVQFDDYETWLLYEDEVVEE